MKNKGRMKKQWILIAMALFLQFFVLGCSEGIDAQRDIRKQVEVHHLQVENIIDELVEESPRMVIEVYVTHDAMENEIIVNLENVSGNTFGYYGDLNCWSELFRKEYDEWHRVIPREGEFCWPVRASFGPSEIRVQRLDLGRLIPEDVSIAGIFKIKISFDFHEIDRNGHSYNYRREDIYGIFELFIDPHDD